MHNSLMIANEIIKLSLKENIPITARTIEKLIYLCQGYSLALCSEPITYSSIHAWRFGIVIPVIYVKLSSHINRPITKQLSRYYDPLGDYLDEVDEESWEMGIIEGVWDKFKNCTAAQLSSFIMKNDSPWKITWEKDSYGLIPNKLIKEYFKQYVSRIN